MELICVAGLAYTLYIRRAEEKPIDFSTAAFIVALGLVVQANLMRLVGPAGDQNLLGILDIAWFPAVTSLLWATAGSALTIWSRKVTSRALWVSGAVLLVASAVKLVLFDFGSLGQLREHPRGDRGGRHVPAGRLARPHAAGRAGGRQARQRTRRRRTRRPRRRADAHRARRRARVAHGEEALR